MTRSQAPCQTQDEPKLIKQRKCQELGTCSQLLALKGVKGGVLKLRDGTRKSDKLLVTHLNLHPTDQQVGQFTFWSTLSARTSHGQLWTHKTHHGPDSREATTFPHIVFFAPFRGTYIRMVFLSQGSQGGVPKLSRFGLPPLCEVITLCSDLQLG